MPQHKPDSNPFSETARLRRQLFRISEWSDRAIFLVSFVVVGLLIAAYGFYLPEELEIWIDATVLTVIWLFVVDYALKLSVAMAQAVTFRSGFFLRSHFRRRWIHLLLTLSILTQNALFFNWFGIERLDIFLRSIDYRLLTQVYLAVTQLYLFVGFLAGLAKYSSRFAALKFHPSQSIVLGFLMAILMGAALLTMPKCTVPGKTTGLMDALFTATSAVCVTGLTVVDTGSHFTLTGQIVILLLIQIGGIGVITFATFFAMFFSSGVTFRERVLVRDVLNAESFDEAGKTLRQIFFITFFCEIAGAVVLFESWGPRWSAMVWDGAWQRAYYAAFHAVSAFCNAGFALWPDSLAREELGWASKYSVAGLIVAGGLGFTVIRNVFSVAFHRLVSRPMIRVRLIWDSFWKTLPARLFSRKQSGVPDGGSARRFHTIREMLDRYRDELSVQSRFVLILTVILIASGVVVLLALETSHVLAGLSAAEKIHHAVFQAITARTAGFNTVPIDTLGMSAFIMIVFLMFIGASPGSTGGGIKTTTFGIMLVSSFGNLRGQDRIRIFRRQLPAVAIVRALMVVTFAVTAIFLAVFSLSLTDPTLPIHDVLFEAVSAFATVGLSRGITGELSDAGRAVIMACMFLGRVGTLSIAFAVASEGRSRQEETYPEENLMVG
jgi:Trk-type K+ transport system membrane component